jgi:hypothetical protein
MSGHPNTKVVEDDKPQTESNKVINTYSDGNPDDSSVSALEDYMET